MPAAPVPRLRARIAPGTTLTRLSEAMTTGPRLELVLSLAQGPEQTFHDALVEQISSTADPEVVEVRFAAEG